MRRGPVATALALVLAATGCTATSSADGEASGVRIAAAADLRPAFEVLGERFEAETGRPVTFVFGSSGQLAQQLVEGAPMDVFASADAGYVDQVLEADRGDAATRHTYAVGRLAIWSRGDRWSDWRTLEDVADDDEVVHVAVANPDHAPYGRAAVQALERSGAAELLADRLVFGENVLDTQRLAESGNADVAVVALSLAIAAEERGEGRWRLVDEALHEPLRQDLIVTADDPDGAAVARRFVGLVAGEDGREVMRRFGFAAPDGRPPADGSG